MRVPAYRKMLLHEFLRPHNEHLMSDIYDAPAWKEFMGRATLEVTRIGLSQPFTACPHFVCISMEDVMRWEQVGKYSWTKFACYVFCTRSAVLC